MNLDELAEVLKAFGCPAEKSRDMAAQLDKRAQQLAERNSQSYAAAMAHLLELMRQGWAARERGL